MDLALVERRLASNLVFAGYSRIGRSGSISRLSTTKANPLRSGDAKPGASTEAAQPPKGDGSDAAPCGLHSPQDVRRPGRFTSRARPHDDRRIRSLPIHDHDE